MMGQVMWSMLGSVSKCHEVFRIFQSSEILKWRPVTQWPSVGIELPGQLKNLAKPPWHASLCRMEFRLFLVRNGCFMGRLIYCQGRSWASLSTQNSQRKKIKFKISEIRKKQRSHAAACAQSLRIATKHIWVWSRQQKLWPVAAWCVGYSMALPSWEERGDITSPTWWSLDPHYE